MSKERSKHFKNACPSKTEEEDSESNLNFFDRLTLNSHKNSIDCCEPFNYDKDLDSLHSLAPNDDIPPSKKECSTKRRGKPIQKKDKEGQQQKKVNMNRKRRIAFLEHRVQELEKQVFSLRRDEHYCLNCRSRHPNYYRQKMSQLILPEEPSPAQAGNSVQRSDSKDSLQFQKINFHVPLMQTQEMQEKMWIFLGTMLIAMGSKVMDFDGTINTFRVLKQSVDRIRREVEKGQTSIGMDFFCCKEEINQPGSLIDGMNYDPFYNNKEDPIHGHFSLEGVKIEAVEEYQLFYDYKYNFNIKYDSLLTIMEYARDHCGLS